MGRPLRMFEPDGLYFVTGRCLQARFFMRPSPETNAVIGGVLARAVERFDVDLYAFVFTSNHFHLILGSRHCNIPAFMQYFRGNLAKTLGRLIGWPGKFWDRRYDAEPILDDEAAIGRLRYVLAHGVKEGLVARVDHWPGLSCLPELRDGVVRAFAWPTTSSSAVAGDSPTPPTPLRTKPLPCWQAVSRHEQGRMVRELVADIEAEADSTRSSAPLGAASILARDPHHRPARPARRRRPLCHASSANARAAYAAKYQSFVLAFREAAQRDDARDTGRNRDARPPAYPLYAYRPPGIRPELMAA